jgi:hypothetical protein
MGLSFKLPFKPSHLLEPCLLLAGTERTFGVATFGDAGSFVQIALVVNTKLHEAIIFDYLPNAAVTASRNDLPSGVVGVPEVLREPPPAFGAARSNSASLSVNESISF